jgi:hypothetical protein
MKWLNKLFSSEGCNEFDEKEKRIIKKSNIMKTITVILIIAIITNSIIMISSLIVGMDCTIKFVYKYDIAGDNGDRAKPTPLNGTTFVGIDMSTGEYKYGDENNCTINESPWSDVSVSIFISNSYIYHKYMNNATSLMILLLAFMISGSGNSENFTNYLPSYLKEDILNNPIRIGEAFVNADPNNIIYLKIPAVGFYITIIKALTFYIGSDSYSAFAVWEYYNNEIYSSSVSGTIEFYEDSYSYNSSAYEKIYDNFLSGNLNMDGIYSLPITMYGDVIIKTGIEALPDAFTTINF